MLAEKIVHFIAIVLTVVSLGPSAVALTLIVFFIWVFPGNQATQNWTVAPADWRTLRARWEFGHSVNAIIVFASLCALTAAALLSRGGSRYGP